MSFLFLLSPQPLKSHVRTYSPLDTNESEWQISQIGLQFLVTHDHFVSGKLKIRCSASIYDIYWQSTEVSAEEDRPRVIHYEPAATIVGINYLQPPPNFQTGQKKPDGQVGVKGKASFRFSAPDQRDAVSLSQGGKGPRKYIVVRGDYLSKFETPREPLDANRVRVHLLGESSIYFSSFSSNIRRPRHVLFELLMFALKHSQGIQEVTPR